jgi:hypothetical protein
MYLPAWLERKSGGATGRAVTVVNSVEQIGKVKACLVK